MKEKIEELQILNEIEIYNLSVLERKLKIGQGLISKHVRGKQNLSVKNINKLNRYCTKAVMVNNSVVSCKNGKIKIDGIK